MGESLDHLVHRTVPAQNQRQIGSLAYGLPNERACLSRRGSGKEARTETDAGKRRNGTLKNKFGIAPRHASGGIIDQNRLAKQCNSFIIREPWITSPEKLRPCARNCGITSICITSWTRRRSPTPNTTR